LVLLQGNCHDARSHERKSMNYVMVRLDLVLSRILIIVVLGYGFDVHTRWDDHSVGTKQEPEDWVTPT
jgi:hypothetical protein